MALERNSDFFKPKSIIFGMIKSGAYTSGLWGQWVSSEEDGKEPFV